MVNYVAWGDSKNSISFWDPEIPIIELLHTQWEKDLGRHHPKGGGYKNRKNTGLNILWRVAMGSLNFIYKIT